MGTAITAQLPVKPNMRARRLRWTVTRVNSYASFDSGPGSTPVVARRRSAMPESPIER